MAKAKCDENQREQTSGQKIDRKQNQNDACHDGFDAAEVPQVSPGSVTAGDGAASKRAWHDMAQSSGG